MDCEFGVTHFISGVCLYYAANVWCTPSNQCLRLKPWDVLGSSCSEAIFASPNASKDASINDLEIVFCRGVIWLATWECAKYYQIMHLYMFAVVGNLD